ncbi:MAG: VWA domain-containing protein [Okeania sp. SIO3I5]|uniref:VWA domain-containing protein n=1 Tax=Okeania sp. SIO3I5 TaxID=2607805 RepID=UPI0013B97DCC|nr:VWA domain-containing protein [Okeania sp. SIO3I5]NEQ40080.1 VWA domain-containing protein [Okeania sp. SIO3I5]
MVTGPIAPLEPLAVNEITNWYLYGQETTPTNLADESLIRPEPPDPLPSDIDIIKIPIDATQFMDTVGRFAIGSQFELVQRFFYEDGDTLFELGPEGTVIPVILEWEEFYKPGTYKKAQLARDEFNMDSFGWTMQHLNWRDETDDYAERTYLYNTQEYKISDDALFIVETDGTKRIENFAIEPREVAEEDPDNLDTDRDNFDFDGGSPLTNIGNAILKPNVDPSGIGRTVYFDYVNEDSIPEVTYDREAYDADVLTKQSFTEGANLLKLNEDITKLTDDLFNDGVTRFLDDQNRPIFYGTQEADFLEAPLNAPKLTTSYDENGILVIGSIGNDTLESIKDNSELRGGDGNDRLIGRSGNGENTFIGGKGNDVIGGGIPFSLIPTDFFGENEISVYEGPREKYNIEFLSDDVVKITDTVEDRDGTDELIRVGFAKFLDQTVRIGPGLDISFVIDRTGSMSDDMQAVKAAASQIIDEIFDEDRGLLNSRISVVGYNDSGPTTYLSFTEQPKIEDRKTAAINAINSISISGGYEPVNGALIHSLNGSAGEWREEAIARRIFLFGDEPADDPELLSEVLELASDVGVSRSASSLSASSIASDIETSSVNENLAVTRFALQTTEPDGTSTTVPVEIFTIMIGSNSAASRDFQNLATETGGEFFNPANASEVVDAILAAIGTPITEEEIHTIEGTSSRDNLIGTDGDDTITGFRRGDTLTGGDGDDIFVYTSLRDGRDTITDFEVGRDKIDLVEVLDVVGFAGVDPIADGYVGFASTSNSTYLTIDPDGSAGTGSPRSLVEVQEVTAAELNNSDNFIFS